MKLANLDSASLARSRIKYLFEHSQMNVCEDTAAYISKFSKEFDPSILYPDDWWKIWIKSFPRSDVVALDICEKFVEIEVSFAEFFLSCFAKGFSYSVPTFDAIADIGKFSQGKIVHEYMSGSGYWAYLMRSLGIPVVASDIKQKIYDFNHIDTFVDVEYKDIKSDYPEEDVVIMLSWIPNGLDVSRFLNLMHKNQKLICIGDPSCCSIDETHNCIKREFDTIYEKELLGCYGTSYMQFLIRK